jgi:hypothetical protein
MFSRFCPWAQPSTVLPCQRKQLCGGRIGPGFIGAPGPQVFVRNQIATEQPSQEGGFIVKDLPGDAEIVTRGAQFLLSEEFRAQIQVGEDR